MGDDSDNISIPAAVDKDAKELALKRYDAILRYMAADVASYWTRTQLMLVAHASLLGFLSTQIKDISGDPASLPWFKLNLFMFESATALWLCAIWHSAIKSSQGWIDYWRNVLKNKLEAQAFEGVFIYRGDDLPKDETRNIATRTQWLFTIVWAVAFFVFAYWEFRKFRQI